jgi:predicted membrane protein
MKNYNQNSGCLGKETGLFLGLLVMLAGSLLLAFNLGWADASLRQIVFSWPIIFVIFGVVSLFKLQYLITLFWTTLGAFFLLPRIAKVYPDALPWVDGNFASNYWPVLLILVGIGLVLNLFFKKQIFFVFGTKIDSFGQIQNKTNAGNSDGIYTRNIVFGGAEDVFLEPEFRGGNISVVFGGVELDLRKTTILEGDTYLNIDVVFGGVELRVPDSWKVINEVKATFGGVEESRKIWVADIDESRRLIITGSVVFGGLEIS